MSAAVPGSYERGRADPVFLSRFAAAYRGEYEPLDALWWLEHPGQDAPSGARSPEARLEPLEAAVFGRESGDRGDAAVALERALGRMREERELALEALSTLEIAEAGRDTTTGSTPRPGPARYTELTTDPRAELATDPSAELATVAGAPGQQTRPRRSRRRVVVGCVTLGVGALLIGLAAGTLVPRDGGSGSGDDAPVAGDISGVLAVFDRPLDVDLEVPALIGTPSLDLGTLRQVGEAGPVGVFVARDAADDLCLVLVEADGEYVSTCVQQDRFPAAGLPLHGTFVVPAAPGDDILSGTAADVDVLWTPDGNVTGSSTAPPLRFDYLGSANALPGTGFEVFERPSQPEDRLPDGVTASVVAATDPTTIRLLAADDGGELFAAQLLSGTRDVCLIRVVGVDAVSACGPTPITLQVQGGSSYALSTGSPGDGWGQLATDLWVRR